MMLTSDGQYKAYNLLVGTEQPGNDGIMAPQHSSVFHATNTAKSV